MLEMDTHFVQLVGRKIIFERGGQINDRDNQDEKDYTEDHDNLHNDLIVYIYVKYKLEKTHPSEEGSSSWTDGQLILTV